MLTSYVTGGYCHFSVVSECYGHDSISVLIRVIEVRVVSPEAIKSIDRLTMMRHHYQPRLKIDRSLLSMGLRCDQ